MKLIICYFVAVLATINSSKCPESKKPHSASCIMFYNCVNLPSGGYVWVPSKCTEGLVFQPYLRTCVLPGDTWTCDLSIESSLTKNKYQTPEIIDVNFDESGSTELPQDYFEFSELADSSYTTYSQVFEEETVTSSSPMEIEKEGTNQENDNVKENHLYPFYRDKNQNLKDRYSLLGQLINHLLIYKEITVPLDFLESSSFSTSTRPIANASLLESSKKPEGSNRNSILMNYLIQNYIQQNNLQNNIIDGVRPTESESSQAAERETDNPILNNEQTENVSEMLTRNLDSENNVILITDNLGNKQYFTIEKYKSVAHRLNSQFTRIVPCIKNIRLPNTTDCAKYYTCEPRTASVTDYSCPLNSAFNKFARICDTDSGNACIRSKSQKGGRLNVTDSTNQADKTEGRKVCTEIGKIKDPNSDSHYYICYSPSGSSRDIKQIRLTCPNSLIFCQSKKVCTTKRLCKIT